MNHETAALGFQTLSGLISLALFACNEHRAILPRISISAIPLLLMFAAPWMFNLIVWNLRMAETLR